MRKENEIIGWIKCQDCGQVNEWYYHIPDNIESISYHVHKIDGNKVSATITEGTRIEPKEFKVRCKNCGYPNFLKYKDE